MGSCQELACAVARQATASTADADGLVRGWGLQAAYMRETHAFCDEHNDVATASLLEVWIDETERRTWFLFETTR
jgi:DNA-binding ferritin-like protein